MFDKAIIDTDKFMDLSMSSKALYFLLGMEADDEGFVSYKKVMRIHGGNEDDFKVLVLKGFLIHFESGVVVITNWNQNNYLDKNRIRPTEYQKEKEMLTLTKNRLYELNNGLTSIVEYSIGENSIVENKDSDKVAITDSENKKVINNLIELFKNVNPSYKTFFANKTERACLERLLKEHGREKLIEIIEVLPKTNLMEFAPVITSPFKLEKKLGDLIAFVEKKNSKTSIKKIITL